MVKPLSEDARNILSMIRKHPGIEGKHIAMALGIDMHRLMKGTSELYERDIVRMQFLHERQSMNPEYFEIARFFPR